MTSSPFKVLTGEVIRMRVTLTQCVAYSKRNLLGIWKAAIFEHRENTLTKSESSPSSLVLELQPK